MKRPCRERERERHAHKLGWRRRGRHWRRPAVRRTRPSASWCSCCWTRWRCCSASSTRWPTTWPRARGGRATARRRPWRRRGRSSCRSAAGPRWSACCPPPSCCSRTSPTRCTRGRPCSPAPPGRRRRPSPGAGRWRGRRRRPPRSPCTPPSCRSCGARPPAPATTSTSRTRRRAGPTATAPTATLPTPTASSSTSRAPTVRALQPIHASIVSQAPLIRRQDLLPSPSVTASPTPLMLTRVWCDGVMSN
ncbi:Sigma-fimbriae usher protein [Levilactobacillus brevis]|nr:Sigma-fimbriae usher protein [Levilactobacillus brevis]